LCGDKNFSEERVRNGAKKLCKAKQGTTQGRLDSFFKVLPSNKPAGTPPASAKRKVAYITLSLFLILLRINILILFLG
jgi:flap endonuclease-1